MTTNMEMPNVETIDINKDDGEESELMNQDTYHRSMNNHEKIMKNLGEILKIHKKIRETDKKAMKYHERVIINYEQELRSHKIILKLFDNEYSMSDEELDITCIDSIEKYLMKPLDFESLDVEMPKLDFDQPYVKIIEKLYYKKKNVQVKDQENEDNKKQKIKHEDCESDLHTMLLEKIINLYAEMKWWLNNVIQLYRKYEWWQQGFEENVIQLMTMMTERQKTEQELMKVITKVTKLQNLYNSYEKEKANLLKNKSDKTSGRESFNASTSQKRMPRKKGQQTLSDINSVSSNLQDILREKVPEKQDPKDFDIDYTKLASVIWRQEMMEEEELIDTEMDIIMGLLKQINNSLDKLLQNFEILQNKRI